MTDLSRSGYIRNNGRARISARRALVLLTDLLAPDLSRDSRPTIAPRLARTQCFGLAGLLDYADSTPRLKPRAMRLSQLATSPSPPGFPPTTPLRPPPVDPAPPRR